MFPLIRKLSILKASLLILFTSTSQSQNLVPNPSFENYGTLPCSWILTSLEFSQAMDNWIMPTAGSTDVFSTLVPSNCYANCLSTTGGGPGIQSPHSGDVMSAILTYGDGCGSQPDYREYLEVELTTPLVIGKSYKVEMFVSLGDFCAVASNNIGVNFSINAIGSNLCTELNEIPQINFTDIILEMVNWVQLVDTFVAASAFDFMTIGNFYDNQNTQHITLSGPSINARYFIDDISVSEVIAAAPSAIFMGDTATCQNLCIDFFDLSQGDPDTWLWLFPGASPASSTDQNPTDICYNNSGAYDVTLIVCNATGCDTLTLNNYVSVTAPPAAVITQSNDTLFSSTAFSYQWYTGGNPIPGATDFFYVPLQEDFYSVVITDSNGCSSADTIYFTLGPLAGFIVSDAEICEKFCIDFFDQSINNPTSWLWEFPGGAPATSTDQNPIGICYTVPGIYDVTLITSNTFGSDTLSLLNYITVYLTPPFPTITQNGNVLTSSPAAGYQWQFNSIDITGATNQSYTVTQAGYYTVVITDSNGCKNSTTIVIDFTGFNDLTDDSQVTIYPNPSAGIVMVEGLNTLMDNPLSFRVVNTLGQLVFSSEEKIYVTSWKKEIDLSHLANGMYHIEIKMKDSVMRKKITISR